MCVVSNVGDHYRDAFPNRWPQIPFPLPRDKTEIFDFVSKEEFEKLKQELASLKELLEAAVKYDKVTGQPHCETDEKIALIKKLADLVGVKINFE